MARKKLILCSRAAFGSPKAKRLGRKEYSGWITQGKNSLRSRSLNPGGYLFSVSLSCHTYLVHFSGYSSFTTKFYEKAKKAAFFGPERLVADDLSFIRNELILLEQMQINSCLLLFNDEILKMGKNLDIKVRILHCVPQFL